MALAEEPELIAIAAQSLDGFIARSVDEFVDWTPREDKRMFAKATKEAGVVIMGRRTFDTFGARPLPDRLNFVLTSRPETMPKHKDVYAGPDTPRGILDELDRMAVPRAFVIGGASVYRQFLETGHLSQVWITVVPILLGKGIHLFEQSDYNEAHWSLLSSEPLVPGSDSVQLKYKLTYD